MVHILDHDCICCLPRCAEVMSPHTVHAVDISPLWSCAGTCTLVTFRTVEAVVSKIIFDADGEVVRIVEA